MSSPGERDIGDLREGRFVQSVSGTRRRLNVSPDMQIGSYWQYDTLTRSVGTNSKLRWTFRAVGDLFVIYNHHVREVTDRWALDSNQLLVKLQYAFRYWVTPMDVPQRQPRIERVLDALRLGLLTGSSNTISSRRRKSQALTRSSNRSAIVS